MPGNLKEAEQTMETIFPREEKTDLLFQKILENPEACRILAETFYNEFAPDGSGAARYLDQHDFTHALLNAYTNRDLTSLLIALTGNSMFDLLRNSFLIPFRFDEDGVPNPIILTDEDGNLVENPEVPVPDRDYERFRKEFRKMKDCRMYLAYGWRIHHVFEQGTLAVRSEKYDAHFGVLIGYERPDTLKMQETEAQAYAALLDTMIALQHEMPGATVYYGQDQIRDRGTMYDGLGVFLSKHHLLPSFETKLATLTSIMHGL